MKIMQIKFGLNFIIKKLPGMSFDRFPTWVDELIMTIESLYRITIEFSKLLLP